MVKKNCNLYESDCKDGGLLFFIAFIPWILTLTLYTNTYFVDYISINFVYIVRSISITILILREVVNFSKKDVTFKTLAMVLFISLVIIISYNSGDFQFFDVFLFACSCRNVKFERVVKVYFICQAIVFSLTIISCFKGILPDKIFFQGERIRHSLGFYYATFSSQTFFYLVASYIYIRKRKLACFELIIIEAIAYFLYKETGTKNPFITTTFLVICVLLMKKFNNKNYKNRFWAFISKYSFIIMSVLAVVSSYFYKSYENNFFYFLNKLFSNRLSLAHNGLINFGVPFLGQKVDFVGFSNSIIYTSQQYNYVDSSYIHLLIVRGWVFLVVLLFLFYIIGKNNFELGDDDSIYLTVILFTISVHSLFDPQLTYLWFSPFILLIGYAFSNNLKRIVLF